MIGEDDAHRIEAAMRAAESRTRAEIVCVVARSSSLYEYVPVVWAALVALAAPIPLILLTALSVQRVYVAQLACFLVAIAIVSLPAIRLALVPRAVRRRRAYRAAAEQFVVRGLGRAPERLGVLVFVSLAERYARIIVGEGVRAGVGDDAWAAAIAGLVRHMRAGEPGQGCVVAIEAVGATLATAFPTGPGKVDALPTRVYLI